MSAPIELAFDYTRSVGPTLGRVHDRPGRGAASSGVRVSDGRVFVPPVEYDPVTGAAVDRLRRRGRRGRPSSAGRGRPSRWRASRCDDAVRVGAGQARRRRHLRAARARRAAPAAVSHRDARAGPLGRPSESGAITDIACFEPADGATDPGRRPPTVGAGRDRHDAGLDARAARGLTAGDGVPARPGGGQAARPALPGLRARSTSRRAAPARSTACRPTEEVELPDRGTVTTFCIVNVPFMGQKITAALRRGLRAARRRRHRASCT